MDERDRLAERFEAHRPRLRAVGYRMLGSLTEADDAVQEAWLRLSGADAGGVENFGGWLTTVVSRVCLNMLRSRGTRREEPLEGRYPDPIVDPARGVDPEHEAILADSVGIALLVVLDTLAPAERLAFVLHDLFDVPFEEIASIVERSPAATRQLASRARRRVRGAAPAPDPDVARQRVVVDAFAAAARGGDLEALVAVLDPDVVARTDVGLMVRGAAAVARRAWSGARFADAGRHVLVNGVAGLIGIVDGRPVSVMAFTVVGGRIVAIDSFNAPERIRRALSHLPALAGQ